MTVKHHRGGVVRHSRPPASQRTVTNQLHGGSQSASAGLSQAPQPNMPGGGVPVSGGQGMPAGPGSPSPDTSVQLPPGMPPVNPGR